MGVSISFYNIPPTPTSRGVTIKILPASQAPARLLRSQSLMKASFTDCSVLRTKRPFLLSQTTTIAIVGWWHWLHQGSLATVITEPRGVVQVVKTYFPYRFRADAGELVRTAGVLVRYQLGRVVPGHVGSRPSATHLGKGTEHQHRRRKWHTHTQRAVSGWGKRCKSKFNYSNLFNLLALRHAIIYGGGTENEENGTIGKDFGAFSVRLGGQLAYLALE